MDYRFFGRLTAGEGRTPEGQLGAEEGLQKFCCWLRRSRRCVGSPLTWAGDGVGLHTHHNKQGGSGGWVAAAVPGGADTRIRGPQAEGTQRDASRIRLQVKECGGALSKAPTDNTGVSVPVNPPG